MTNEPSDSQMPAKPASSSDVPLSNKLASNNLLLIGLGVSFGLVACLTLLVGGYYLAGPKIIPLLQKTTPIPTRPCLQPKLEVGSLTLIIETISLNPDGTLPDIPKKAGTAYWTGTQPNYLFLLPQVRENLDAIPSLKAGDTLVITSADCSQGVFVVSSVAPRNPFLLQQIDQTASSAMLILPVDPNGTVMVVTGIKPENSQVQAATAPPEMIFLPLLLQGQNEAQGVSQQGSGLVAPESQQGGGQEMLLSPTPELSAPAETVTIQPTATSTPEDTPVPTETFIPMPTARGGVEAEIGFLDKNVSAKTITLGISIYNYSASAFTLYAEDVHLLPPGAGAVALSSASPDLPQQVAADATQEFTFSFPNPGGNGIVFQIFNMEFNLDDF